MCSSEEIITPSFKVPVAHAAALDGAIAKIHEVQLRRSGKNILRICLCVCARTRTRGCVTSFL